MATTELDNIKLLKKSISNVDIFALAYELNNILQDGFITNIYEIPSSDGKLISLKCRTKDGKRNIIIDPKKRINLTEFEYPHPKYPSQFILSLRKFMKGRRIEKVFQYNLDRILIIQLGSSEGESWKFIIEFFGGGNYILIDGGNMVTIAKSYKKMREREILPKKIYNFPISKGKDLLNLTFEDFKQEINETKGELVRIIARSFNVGGYVSEEICLRSNIKKKESTELLNDTQIHLLYKNITELSQTMRSYDFKPHLILNEKKQAIGFEPIYFNIYSEFEFDNKSSFNEAVDEFFSKFDSEAIFSGEEISSKEKLTKNEKILIKQEEKIKESLQIREKSLEEGHLIYQYIKEIDSLIQTIMFQKRERNLSWTEISDILSEGKKKKIPECQIFDKLYPQEVKIQIELEGYLFKLDLKKTAIDNAQELYSTAKKAKKKMLGAEKAIIESKIKIEKQKEDFEQVESQKAILIKRPKMKWYEKYRWFYSSDEFLIIGGRDASSNEFIVKKHMNNNDLFFHTDVRGASVCIIKNDENRVIPPLTIKETATFAACYSSAWKQGWGSAEIFYVLPEQVSKTPKSGEYLKKGSFVINGKKNFLTKPFLEIAIGVILVPILDNTENLDQSIETEIDETKPENFEQKNNSITNNNELTFFPFVISAPSSSIKRKTSNYVRIVTSKKGEKSSSLAKHILSILISKASEEEKKWIRMTSLDDLIRIIPPGTAEIVK